MFGLLISCLRITIRQYDVVSIPEVSMDRPVDTVTSSAIKFVCPSHSERVLN